MNLPGTRRDGSAVAIKITARTTRVRLYQQPDVAALDLAGIGAAPGLAIFESASQGPIRVSHLEALSALPALTDLSLALDADSDVSVLARVPALRHLHLHLWDRATFDTAWLRGASSLTSLSLSFHGALPNVELAELTQLRQLSLGGVANRQLALPSGLEGFYIDHSPALERLDGAALASLRTLNVIDCAGLREVDTEPFAGGPLELVNLAEVPSLETFGFIALGRATHLRSLTLTGHAMRFLDLTPLAKLAGLRGLMVDGKDAPFVDAGPIASPALRQWDAAGGLRREL